MIRPRIYTVFFALGAFVAGMTPFVVRAQSGDALAKAELVCKDYGVTPYSVTFDTCVARAAAAYDQAAPDRALVEARRTADARETCMSYDIDPMTLGFHQCVASESQPHSAYAANVVPDSN